MPPGGLVSKVKNGQRLVSNYTNATTSLTNVGLGWAINANEVWTGEFNLSGQCSSTGGTQFAITIPSGATIEAECFGITSAVTAFTSSRITASGVATTQVFFIAAAVPGPVRITVTVVNGATPGSVQLQAKSVTSTQTTTIFAGSYVTARPTA
jgi:hypothetical protein